MRRNWFLFFSCLCLACSSSSENPPAPPVDSGSETGDSGVDSASDAKDAPVDTAPITPLLSCGAGPYRATTMVLSDQGLATRGLTLAVAAKVTFSACPESAGMTDGEGFADVKLTIGTPTSAKIEAPGALTTIFQEFTPQPWMSQLEWAVIKESAKADIPGYAADKPVVLVYLAPDPGAGSYCALADGVALTVEGHPEAKITYHAGTKPFGPTTDTVSTVSGIATITGLAAGTKVSIKGTKTGCNVLPSTSPGGVPLEAGAVSIATLLVEEGTIPSCGSPPHIKLGGTVTTRELDGSTGTPLAGVDIAWSGCPGTTVKTATDGTWQAYFTQDMPTDQRYTLAGYITVDTIEAPWPFSYPTLNNAMRNKTVWATPELMPGFDDTHGFVSMGIGAPKTGACSALDGITFTVKGHPDAKIVYTNGEPPKAVAGATSTAKRGSAYISGLVPGTFSAADITAAKTGCTLTPAQGKVKTGGGELSLFSFTMK